MSLLGRLTLLLAITSAPAAANWRAHTLQSTSLDESLEYYLYVPPDDVPTPEGGLPVLYWLHGLGGSGESATALVELVDAAIREGRLQPMFVVSPSDPTKRSMWTDSKDGTAPMETVITDELIPHIDASHPTRAARAGRAIEGFSMGGYGAALIGFKHPDLFAGVSILAGALHTPDSLRELRRSIFDAVYRGDGAYAEAQSPWSVLRKNADRIRGSIHVRIHVGEEDGLLERNQRYHALLEHLSITHTWSVIPKAPHDLALLLSNWLGDPIMFYQGVFTAP